MGLTIKVTETRIEFILASGVSLASNNWIGKNSKNTDQRLENVDWDM